MRTYAPAQRVDQAAGDATSVHGGRLAQRRHQSGQLRRHGGHGARKVSDAKSPVYLLNVAATCAKRHADPAHMAGYTTESGAPLPTNQFEGYSASVHARALVGKQTCRALTCNDRHGNHGGLRRGRGGECGMPRSSRSASRPAYKDVPDKGCVECHQNHKIAQPSDALLGTQPDSLWSYLPQRRCKRPPRRRCTPSLACRPRGTGGAVAVARRAQCRPRSGQRAAKPREARNHPRAGAHRGPHVQSEAVTKVTTEGSPSPPASSTRPPPANASLRSGSPRPTPRWWRSWWW
ncbi:MAG: hypothetical protein U0P30_09205 [Vicinamibacterales bacterium]